ncbi:helix-turn-helix domain-containing protein [Nocardiopsis sp. CC223A]|uniref:helix-turn-helix domain-containing protein n=1 Tax=Nocardiopsis sp. CC223A TaxID=3044051 RepID=UPI00278C46A1|nr:helix-turn-helix domain-containing protein [Nocardiopsis sp. CC223A]
MEGLEEDRGFDHLVLRYRTRAGLTQQELADFSTISVRAIRDLEHGRAQRPRRDTVRLLADALRLNDRDRGRLEAAAGRTSGTDLRIGASGAAVPPPAGAVPVGRVDEADTLTADLGTAGRRIITLTGAPGAGKTTLAMEVAGRLHRRSDLPVLWVGPGGAGHPAVPEALYGAGGREAREHLGALTGSIGDAEALLVLDSPRPTAPDARALAELLADCPGLRVLSTAHRPHRVPGEQVFLVDPLREEDAVELLRGLLAAAGADTPDGDPGPARICALLDHLPGALRTVASWAAVYGTATLLESLRENPLPLLAPLDPGSGDDLAAALRRALADRDPHEEAVLEVLCQAPDGEPADTLAQRAGLGLADCGRALMSLVSGGLVRRLPDGARSRFHALCLVRAVRGAQGRSEERREMAL